jgi:hypothetical protein
MCDRSTDNGRKAECEASDPSCFLWHLSLPSSLINILKQESGTLSSRVLKRYKIH